ncbi:MAG: translation initiation factor IF-2, partial [Gammaproteobacteria bacterium]
MAEMTVKQFSETVKVPLERLLKQMQEAGLKDKDENSPISNEEKRLLLEFLRGRHQSRDSGAAAGTKKVVLRRKSTMELPQRSATTATGPRGGRGGAAASTGKKVNVEVRKRRTYARRSDLESARKAAEEQAEQEIS